MKQFDQLYGRLLSEQDNRVFNVGIFPGAFKPPHIGHYATAYNACKNNEKVYIFVSDKPRPLSTTNTGGGAKETPDSARYGNILKSDKYTDRLLSVQTAGVARMTSATAFRAAIAIKDKNTIAKNLPEGSDIDRIYKILMGSNELSSPTYGHITVDQAMAIWNIYKPLLQQQTGLGEDDIIIKVSTPSPVKDTYDLVDELNNSEHAGMTSVKLYVGE